MLLIAEFLERSQAWQEKVQKKKEKAAEEAIQKKESENTFHPRINTISAALHAQKLSLLEQVNEAAAKNQKKLTDMPLQVGLLEKETKENLFEYYLPQRKLLGSSQERREAS